MIILDIGCGRKKVDGAIGVDFSSMSDADIVLDLNNQPLPFDDNSVDFVYSSHTLEHLSLDGFFNVMREAYRVLRPGAQFKIVVPYFTTALNLANPFHNNNICFNEHTFRFFSSDAECEALPKCEWETPSCPHWGLRYSANSEIGIEFKTLSVEKFFLPKYSILSEAEKIAACSSWFNVVEQISYSLEAVKPCPVRPETGPVSPSDDPHLFVARQLSFLAEQLEFLTALGVSTTREIQRGKRYLRSERKGSLYLVDRTLSPVNFFVHELDDVIQSLRRAIDSRSMVTQNIKDIS